MTGIAGCCARAASGHVAAAPPSSVMNSRRAIIRSPRRRAAGRIPELSTRAPYDEIELRWLHDRKVRGLLPLEKAPRIDACLAIHVDINSAIAHQLTGPNRDPLR